MNKIKQNALFAYFVVANYWLQFSISANYFLKCDENIIFIRILSPSRQTKYQKLDICSKYSMSLLWRKFPIKLNELHE